MLRRAPLTKETIPDFFLNMDLDKRDTTVWYRVTRNPQEFRGLTGIQQDPQIWSVIVLFIPAHLHHSNENLKLASKSLITIHYFLSFFFSCLFPLNIFRIRTNIKQEKLIILLHK